MADGAEQIIPELEATHKKVESFAVDHIDKLIARLHELKRKIQAKRKDSSQSSADFIIFIDEGLAQCQLLNAQAELVEENLLGADAAKTERLLEAAMNVGGGLSPAPEQH